MRTLLLLVLYGCRRRCILRVSPSPLLPCPAFARSRTYVGESVGAHCGGCRGGCRVVREKVLAGDVVPIRRFARQNSLVSVLAAFLARVDAWRGARTPQLSAFRDGRHQQNRAGTFPA